MKIERKGPSDGRHEYHWRVDQEQGFDSAKFIYDSSGRLIAVDYSIKPAKRRVDESSADQRADA